MKAPPRIPLLACALALTLPAFAGSFGTGLAGLTAAVNEPVKLESPDARIAIRFTAASAGPLEEISFGSNHGFGYAAYQTDAFSVALHADADGLPGKLLATAGRTAFNATGSRLRTADFQGKVALRPGVVYHAVISSSSASAAQHFGIEAAKFARNVTPVLCPDLTATDHAAGLLVSTDAGASWSLHPQAIAAHRVVIAGHPQGWAYTGTFDLRLQRGLAGNQFAQQFFRFLPAEKTDARPDTLRVALRPQGALVNRPVVLFARIVEDKSYRPVAEATRTVTLPDAARFEAIELPFAGDAILKNGADYVLILGLAEDISSGEKDFLFLRGYTWGVGSPNLNDLNWQDGVNCAASSRLPDALDGPLLPNGDMPFFIDYR